MKGYNPRIAKKINKLRKLTEQLKEILSANKSPLYKVFKVILDSHQVFDIIGIFPEDTYEVVLSQTPFVNLGQISGNKKRHIVIDNRDSKISYDKISGYLCNTGDLARNNFVLAVGTLFECYKDEKLFEKLPDEAKPIIYEMQEILQEWECFAEKYSQYVMEKAVENIEKNSALIEAAFEPMFQPEIARRKGKMEQRQARGKLYDDFLEMRHNYKTSQATYMELAKGNLAAEINAFDERMNKIPYLEGLRHQKSLNDKIKKQAASIKRAIDRAKIDRKPKKEE